MLVTSASLRLDSELLAVFFLPYLGQSHAFGSVKSGMELNPVSGHLYVFFKSQRNLIIVLYWVRDGLAIYYKRLERGTFKRLTARLNAPNSELLPDELYMILHTRPRRLIFKYDFPV